MYLLLGRVFLKFIKFYFASAVNIQLNFWLLWLLLLIQRNSDYFGGLDQGLLNLRGIVEATGVGASALFILGTVIVQDLVDRT